jgi:Tol biopolymer transport system component
MSTVLRILSALGLLTTVHVAVAGEDPRAVELANEVARRGWIVFAAYPLEAPGQPVPAKEGRAQTELYLIRPDGSQLRNISNTSEFSEFGGRFSPDGKRLLYRRLPKNKPFNHDTWGAFGELVLANADGSHPVVYGQEGDYPSACWSPDGRRITCLYKQESKIRIHDLQTKKVLYEAPSQGIHQQMYWSGDGKRVCGTANVAGRSWNIAAIDLESRKLTLLSRGGVGSCTPDWFQGDPGRVIYSHRIAGITPRLGETVNGYGFTMLMQATADGKKRALVYGRLLRHVYFGCTSPDDKYVVFVDHPSDGPVVSDMHIIRLADTPMVAADPPFPELKELHPDAKDGPVLDLKLPGGRALGGFEPHWTYAEIGDARP